MINKTCSIITDSNENYVGIIREMDGNFISIQLQDIMFVIPLHRVKTISYGINAKTDLSKTSSSNDEYEKQPAYNNSLILEEATKFSNNTKELGIPIVPKIDTSLYLQNSTEIVKFINNQVHKKNVNSQNKKFK